jgi:hypothetical protein
MKNTVSISCLLFTFIFLGCGSKPEKQTLKEKIESKAEKVGAEAFPFTTLTTSKAI